MVSSVGTMFAANNYGTCGANLTWSLNTSTGVLTISGTGAMTDFIYQAPWYSSRSSIKTVNIGNSVTSIGADAFAYCSSLTSVTIPNSVTSIGSRAFYECSSLTSVRIPNSVTNIGYEAFYCSALTSVYISDIAAWCAISFENSSADFPCSNPLCYANNLYLNDTLVTNLIIPNSVTSIRDYAFIGCSSLTSVTIPNSVTSIGQQAFDGCTGLTSVTIPNSVTSIGEKAFWMSSSLTTITIPNSVTNIGDYAFGYCSSLTSVHISDLAAWCAISFGRSPFYYAYSLYLNETLVTDLIIPNSVTSIGKYAFAYCTNLTSVTIPHSVTSIGERAFDNCNGLTGVYITDLSAWCGITFGDYSANPLCYAHRLYQNNALITDLVIPYNVKNIKNFSFYGCSSIKSVTIPTSVLNIGESAFKNCSNLIYIRSLSSTPPSITSSTFSNIAQGAEVYLSFGNGSISAYSSAEYWKNFNIHPSLTQKATISSTSCAIVIVVEDVQLQSVGLKGGEQQPGNVLEYIGLEPESEYKDVPIVLTSNTGETETVNVSFTTTALELTTKPSKPVSSTTAILLAETNMSDAEVSCGFEYKRNDAPADMDGTKVFCPVASGQMAGRLKNLKDDVYYKYRAFYQSAAGNMYYGDWQYIFTGDVAVEFDPILYTYGAMVVRENEATISGYALAGSEDFTEQGFEYWAETRANGGANAPRRMPAALGEHFFVQASGISLRVTLNNLDAGTVYKYRVYGKVGDQYYYGSEQTFTTQGTYTPPTYTITFANWDGTELQSSQVEEGTLPEYTGATPERPEDERYTYSFNGWTPTIVIASADATYTATYTETPKGQGIDGVQSNHVQCTKVIRNGQIYLLRGDKTYTLQGQEVK